MAKKKIKEKVADEKPKVEKNEVVEPEIKKGSLTSIVPKKAKVNYQQFIDVAGISGTDKVVFVGIVKSHGKHTHVQTIDDWYVTLRKALEGSDITETLK